MRLVLHHCPLINILLIEDICTVYVPTISTKDRNMTEREGGREGSRQAGREGGREAGRQAGREGGRQGGRE